MPPLAWGHMTASSTVFWITTALTPPSLPTPPPPRPTPSKSYIWNHPSTLPHGYLSHTTFQEINVWPGWGGRTIHIGHARHGRVSGLLPQYNPSAPFSLLFSRHIMGRQPSLQESGVIRIGGRCYPPPLHKPHTCWSWHSLQTPFLEQWKYQPPCSCLPMMCLENRREKGGRWVILG